MARKSKITMKNIIFLSALIIILISSFSYAKYIFDRKFSFSVSTAPFYFDAVKTSDTITYERTANATDHETILMTTTPVTLTIKNNNGTNYNSFDTKYEISVVGETSSKFKVENGTSKTIAGGALKNDTITFNLLITDLTKPYKTVTLRVTSTEPYKKSVDIELNVVQKGAIQTIEDLLDLSLAVRDNAKSASVIKERFKLTRDIDFKNKASYDNADRTDYADANKDGTTKATLYLELTQDPGWLPIGELAHKFAGTFNGGEHKISNLYMHKALQTNIGLFGTTKGADIRKFTIVGGEILNDNETAGMVVGRMQGGKIEYVNVDGTSVMSTDKNNPDRDTYAGGIAGYVQQNAVINYCVNKANVTAQFTGDTEAFSGPAGGIVAWMSRSTISNCKNYGNVIGQKFTGGIAGFAGMRDTNDDNSNTNDATTGGTIENCENYGSVTSYIKTGKSGPGTDIGGIAGFNQKNTVINKCKNHSTATITGIDYIGGIVGYNYGKVTNNINYSTKISSSTKQSHVGRIWGYNNGGSGSGNTELGSGEVISNDVMQDPILVNRILPNYVPLSQAQVNQILDSESETSNDEIIDATQPNNTQSTNENVNENVAKDENNNLNSANNENKVESNVEKINNETTTESTNTSKNEVTKDSNTENEIANNTINN